MDGSAFLAAFGGANSASAPTQNAPKAAEEKHLESDWIQQQLDERIQFNGVIDSFPVKREKVRSAVWNGG